MDILIIIILVACILSAIALLLKADKKNEKIKTNLSYYKERVKEDRIEYDDLLKKYNELVEENAELYKLYKPLRDEEEKRLERKRKREEKKNSKKEDK